MASIVRVMAVVVVLLVVPVHTAAAPPGSAGTPAEGASAVIVQAPGAEAAAAAAVTRLGGRVTAPLPIVGGFAALVPAARVADLAAAPGVRAVTADGLLQPTGVDELTPADLMPVYNREIGADELRGRGHTGAGVRVALIDTGVSTAVATMGDLAGRIVPVAHPFRQPTRRDPNPPDVPCVDFSGEGTCDDTFGHGTFMAGLIAGSGAASDGRYAGVAPGAQIVSVKVGGADGSADVSKVLAGIQWVVSFAEHYDIKVLNLALGTDSTVDPAIDPLNLAVQRAWAAGITVVVAAGNFGAGPRTAPDGTTYGTVTKPGDDPLVLTVGAVDSHHTPAISDNRLPNFSSWGPTAQGLDKPDVVAPGAAVVSLRAPGSTIDRLPGLLDGTYRRGSGTSMAAAITSGLAALLLHARPDWRPDDVKAALVASARKVAVDDPRAIGAGQVHGPSALAVAVGPAPAAVVSDGSGSLDATRGNNRVDGEPCTARRDPRIACGAVEGERTAQGTTWDGSEYSESAWTPESWYRSQWLTGWAGHNWQATTWSAGHNWQGHNWQGASWNFQSDDTSYGTPIKGSGSYGSWG
jgi:serine protease AprX